MYYITKGTKSWLKGPTNNKNGKTFKKTVFIVVLNYMYFSLHVNVILLKPAKVETQGNLW